MILMMIMSLLSFGNSCEYGKNCMLEQSSLQNRSLVRKNVIGSNLETCSTRPITGFYRDGTCYSDSRDRGNHSVCAHVTEKFLKYTKSKGNDLSTPNPRYGFSGLKSGDSWCLCAGRWQEAVRAGIKVKVNLKATHGRALEVVDINELTNHSR